MTLASEGRAPAATITQAVARVDAARKLTSYTSTQEEAWLVLAARSLASQLNAISLDVNGDTRQGAYYRRLTADQLATPLKVSNNGDGAVQAVVSVSGAPLTPEPAAEAGFKIERSYYTLDGKEADPAKARQNERFVVVLKMTEPQPQYGRVILADYLPAGFEIDNPHLVSSGDTGTLQLDYRCRDAGAFGIPRRPLHGGLRPPQGVSAGVHGGLRRAGGFARPLRAAAGVRRGHVPARPLWPHRHRRHRHCGGEMNWRGIKRFVVAGPVPAAPLGTTKPCDDNGDGGDKLGPDKKRIWRRRLRATAVIVGSAFVLTAAVTAGWVYRLGPAPLGRHLELSHVVLDRNGRLLRAYATKEGRWRLPATVADVDPRFLKLLFSYEDKRFYEHHGVDPLAMGRAAFQLVTQGHIVSGASTLTMQVARLLEPREHRSFGAKLRQMTRALELEHALSKKQILALYLTMAPYGGNLEGIRAASLAYFGKEPKRLSLAESALLVALPQSPETRRPDRYPARARAARDRVLARAVAQGVLPKDEIARAEAEPVPHARKAMPAFAPHSADHIVALEPDTRIHRLTIDRMLQAKLERLARERARALGPRISVAILAVDNATGEVRARVASSDYFDMRRAGQVDMTQALRSPGSTLKPFIYGIGFEDGLIHPETLIDDRPVRYGSYMPENFDLTFQGTVTVRRALQLSLNVPAIAVLNRVGVNRLSARLTQAGADAGVAERRGARLGDGPRRRRHQPQRSHHALCRSGARRRWRSR